jgi:homoserine kinase
VQVRVPASSANLGPGFDSLALALDLWIDVTVERADQLSITSSGEGSTVSRDRSHLAAQILRQVHGHDNFAVTVDSQIPMGRGLGSSASLVVGVAAASGVDDPLAIAVQYDGHPENAAASFRGGLIAAATINGHTVVRSFPIDPDLSVIAVIPDFQLSTELARDALPPLYSRRDVVHNLSRVPLLLAGLGDSSLLDPSVFGDRIHQPHRATLHPFAETMLTQLVQIGCLGSCWSGAGPTLIGFAPNGRVNEIVKLAAEYCDELRVVADVRRLDVNQTGLVRR